MVRAVRTNGDLPKTYYVKTDGDDSKDGLTIENAWQSPATAAQRAEAGDMIYLMDGIWYDEHVVFANSGIDVAPIVMTAYNGTPTLSGTIGGKAIYMTDKSYITIQNIKINGYGHGVYAYGGNFYNIEVINVTISNNSGVGVFLYSYGRLG